VLDHPHDGRQVGPGSSSSSEDFSAKAWLRSCATDAPFPVILPTTISAPPSTPGEARLLSASAATFVPTIAFQVTAPRIG
jgi:hypothetical protein